MSSGGRAASPPPLPPKPRSLQPSEASQPLAALACGEAYVPPPPPYAPPGPGQSQYVRLFFEAQDLKNADGFMGKMTGNVSDPFCEIYMRDYRQNTQASIAEWKRVGRTELVKNKLNVKFKRSVVVEYAPLAADGLLIRQEIEVKVRDRDKDTRKRTKDEKLGKAQFNLSDVMQAAGHCLTLKNDKQGNIIVTAEPMSGHRVHDLTFDVSCKDLAKKDVMGGADPYFTMHVATPHGAGKSGAGVCMYSNRLQHKSKDLNPTFPTIDTLNSLQLCNNDFDRKIKITVLDWDPEKGLAGTMSMLGGLAKSMAHHKDQEAAAAHVGSGAGKNDEPIGYCFLSLNEMLEKTQKGEGVPLLHPKGKAKPCGTIYVRLVAIPRLSEEEIASKLQLAQAALASAAASAQSKVQPLHDADARKKSASEAAAQAAKAARESAQAAAESLRAEQAAQLAIAPAEAQLAAAKAEMDAAIARFKALEQGLDSSRKDLARKHDAVAEANRKQETAVAEEKKRREEQAKAEEVTARLDAELKAAELLKATAEANISALQKQAAEMERRRVQKTVDADDKEVSSADSD